MEYKNELIQAFEENKIYNQSKNHQDFLEIYPKVQKQVRDSYVKQTLQEVKK